MHLIDLAVVWGSIDRSIESAVHVVLQGERVVGTFDWPEELEIDTVLLLEVCVYYVSNS